MAGKKEKRNESQHVLSLFIDANLYKKFCSKLYKQPVLKLVQKMAEKTKAHEMATKQREISAKWIKKNASGESARQVLQLLINLGL